MNYGLILAAGVGQRMRNGGLPKQFLKLMGKPIIIYTLEKFEKNELVDAVIVVCHGSYVEYMESLIELYHLKKVQKVVVGGCNRQDSVEKGLEYLKNQKIKNDDLVLIHDGVRPLVSELTISENIRVAQELGCAVTVRSVSETVIVSEQNDIRFTDFQKRENTYSITSPQTFKFKLIYTAYETVVDDDMPLLDSAMVYSKNGGMVHLVKEQGSNIKITTPEDYYYLKALLELEENRYVFGI